MHMLNVRLLVALMLCASAIPAAAQSGAGLLVDWRAAGLSEAPPALTGERHVADFGAIPNDGLDDAAAIQAALDDLNGEPGMVLLEAGQYRLEQSVILPGGAVLRGAGSDSTKVVVDFGGSNDDAILIGSLYEGSPHPLPGHPAFGSRDIGLMPGDPIPELAEGDWVELWQDNGSWDSSPAPWAAESTGHIGQVQLKGPDSLRLTEAIPSRFDTTMPLYLRRIEPLRFAGVECLSMERVDNASSGSFIQCFLAVDCWMQGLELRKSVGAHILAARSAHLWVNGCYFHEAWAYDGASTRGYGVALLRHTVFSLVEDNVFRRLRHAMIVKQGAAGNVYAYNYSLEPQRSEPIPDFSGDISLHGHWAQGNLFEANDVANIITDDYWGPSGPGNALYRNRVRLYGLINTSATTNAQIYAGNLVTGSGTLLGQYYVLGSGHTAFGNWVDGMVTPAGSGVSGPNSLHRNTPPDWWDGPEPWPVLGFGMQGTLPARARFEAGVPAICRNPACLPPDTLYRLPSPPGTLAFAWDPVPGATAYQWRGRRVSEAWNQGTVTDSFWQRTLPPGSYRFQLRPECAWRIGAPTAKASANLPVLRLSDPVLQTQSPAASEAEAPTPWVLFDLQGRVVATGQPGQAPPVRKRWADPSGSMWLWQNGRVQPW